jgi:hypothetical protein
MFARPIEHYTTHNIIPLDATPTLPLLRLNEWFRLSNGEWVKIILRDWFECSIGTGFADWILQLEVFSETVWIVNGKRVKARNPIRVGVFERMLVRQMAA